MQVDPKFRQHAKLYLGIGCNLRGGVNHGQPLRRIVLSSDSSLRLLRSKVIFATNLTAYGNNPPEICSEISAERMAERTPAREIQPDIRLKASRKCRKPAQELCTASVRVKARNATDVQWARRGISLRGWETWIASLERLSVRVHIRIFRLKRFRIQDFPISVDYENMKKRIKLFKKE